MKLRQVINILPKNQLHLTRATGRKTMIKINRIRLEYILWFFLNVIQCVSCSNEYWTSHLRGSSCPDRCSNSQATRHPILAGYCTRYNAIEPLRKHNLAISMIWIPSRRDIFIYEYHYFTSTTITATISTTIIARRWRKWGHRAWRVGRGRKEGININQ